MRKIKICGEEFPCEVTMGALLRFNEERGYDISSPQAGNTADAIRFFYYCVESACNKHHVDFGMSLMDFADNCSIAELNDFNSQFKNEESKKK